MKNSLSAQTKLDIATIRKAIAYMKAQNALNAGVVGSLYGVNYFNSQSVGKTPVAPTNVFSAVKGQVERYKKNVLSKEALASKHDVLLKEVDTAIDEYMTTPEYKRFLKIQAKYAVNREIRRFLASDAFQKKITDIVQGAINGVK